MCKGVHGQPVEVGPAGRPGHSGVVAMGAGATGTGAAYTSLSALLRGPRAREKYKVE